MATSGTVTFRINRDQIIYDVLTLIGAIDPENGATPSTVQTNNTARSLNKLVKFWETRGIELWERKYGVIFPQKSQGVFVLGSPGPAGDHACISTPIGAGFVQTTLSANAAAAASTITVTSLTGSSLNTVGNAATTISSTYNIGIQLDTGYVQWTTVNGVPSGTTVTLTNPLTSASTAGNNVYCYQTKLIRPLRILDGFVRQVSQTNDVPMLIIAREQYNRFGQKQSAGTPIQMYYDPQENAGHLYIYPQFQACNQLLYIEFQNPIEDFTSATDDFDMPQEWVDALVFNTAYRVAPMYEVTKDKFDQLRELAKMSYEQLDGWDQETASIYLQPGMWAYDDGVYSK